MRISVFGLGYVGTVGLGCLAQNGHTVVGVDVNKSKVDLINSGCSPIIENGLDVLIREQKALGRISATTDAATAVAETDVSFICVGTPSTPQGHLDIEGIFRVAEDIAQGLIHKADFHVVVIRSTVLPGTNEQVAAIIEKASRKRAAEEFAVVSNPEFLREGTAIHDYYHPSYTLIGTAHSAAAERMKEVYRGIDAPIIISDIRIAELIKYVNNSFHALKISFANEVGGICKSLGLDSRRLMEIFCQDTKLNISSYYLKPGFAFGGSCLPKDLKALNTIAHDKYLRCPVLASIDESNEHLKSAVFDRILGFGKPRIGFLGLSFKHGTDDLRNSPIVDIMERLLGKGFEIKVFDKNVQLSQLVGANREYILSRIPLISRFLVDDLAPLLHDSDVIVVVNAESSFAGPLSDLPPNKIIYDLVNLEFPGREAFLNYHGVSW